MGRRVRVLVRMGSSEKPLVGGVRHCPCGVGGSPMGSSAPGPGLPTGPITAFFLEPLLSPLPWSRLSPPGSPGTAMARRLHPDCHRHSLRGPQAACWPRVSLCPSRAPLACPCPINVLPAPAAAAAGTAPPAGSPPALTLHCHCHCQAGNHRGRNGARGARVGVGVGGRGRGQSQEHGMGVVLCAPPAGALPTTPGCSWPPSRPPGLPPYQSG